MEIDSYIAGLEAQRAKLDTAISAFRALAPTKTPTPEPVAGTVKHRASRLGKETINSAVRRYLRVSGPSTAKAITTALPKFAGLNGPKRKRYSSVTGQLAALERSGEVVRRGDFWVTAVK